jgi:hypothetical protein
LAAHPASKNYADTTRGQSTVNTRTASYTPVLSDAGKTIAMNLGSATTLTLPTNASVAFPPGTVLWVLRAGSGSVSVSAGSTTLRAPGGTSASAQYVLGRLWKFGTDEWFLHWF